MGKEKFVVCLREALTNQIYCIDGHKGGHQLACRTEEERGLFLKTLSAQQSQGAWIVGILLSTRQSPKSALEHDNSRPYLWQPTSLWQS